MAEKKRYLVGCSLAAVLSSDVEQLMEKVLAERKDVREVRTLRGGQRVLAMTEEGALQLAAAHPDLVVEEDLELELFAPMPGLPPRFPTEPPRVVTVKAVDVAGGKPVPKVTVYCAGERLLYQGVTGRNGVARVELSEPTIERVIASPAEGRWSAVIEAPVVENGHLDIELDELVIDGYNWGNRELGADLMREKFSGKGIKVALIDSGIAPHAEVKAAGGFSALQDEDPEEWNADIKGHGTHCGGIVKGIAPEAELYALKVFPGGRCSDLIDAINWCIDNYVDVIGMSLGTGQPSQQVEQALMDAYQRGISCIAAAGNDGGCVSFPAACAHVIAVSAVGKLGTFPDRSAHALQISDYFGYDGNLFFAGFSNYGPEIDLCAPGVAIPSTVPGGYAAWDGTSMAAAHVAGLAALILEAHPEIRTGDQYQPEYLRQIMTSSATDIGLPAEMQGAGVANAATALAGAYATKMEAERNLAAYRYYLEGMLARAKSARNALEESLARLETL